MASVDGLTALTFCTNGKLFPPCVHGSPFLATEAVRCPSPRSLSRAPGGRAGDFQGSVWWVFFVLFCGDENG